jgi:hypothetical protein
MEGLEVAVQQTMDDAVADRWVTAGLRLRPER